MLLRSTRSFFCFIFTYESLGGDSRSRVFVGKIGNFENKFLNLIFILFLNLNLKYTPEIQTSFFCLIYLLQTRTQLQPKKPEEGKKKR